MQQTTNKKFKADGDVAQWGQNIYEVAMHSAAACIYGKKLFFNFMTFLTNLG